MSNSSLTMLSYCKIYSEASLPCITYLRYFKEYLDEKIPLKLWKIVVIKRLRNSSYTPVYDVRPKLLLWFPQHIICPLYSISIQCFSICRLHAIQYNIGYFTLKKVIWCCWYGKKNFEDTYKKYVKYCPFSLIQQNRTFEMLAMLCLPKTIHKISLLQHYVFIALTSSKKTNLDLNLKLSNIQNDMFSTWFCMWSIWLGFYS